MAYMHEFPHSRQFDSDLREILEMYFKVSPLPEKWQAFEKLISGEIEDLKRFVNNYFDNLSIQTEINNKLDAMSKDGSLSELIQPLFNEYKTEINDLIDILSARMDSFTELKDGSTTGDAELQDIRIDIKGITHGTAGEAVRKQLSALYNETTINIDGLQWALGSTDDGVIIESTTRIVSEPLLVRQNTTLYVHCTSQENYRLGLAEYDENMNYLVWHDWTSDPITITNETSFIRILMKTGGNSSIKESDIPKMTSKIIVFPPLTNELMDIIEHEIAKAVIPINKNSDISPSWIQGTLNGDSGEPQSTNTRIRTDFIDVTMVKSFNINCSEDYKYAFHMYDNEKKNLGNIKWTQENSEYFVSDNTYFLRLIACRVDGEKISTIEGSNVNLKVTGSLYGKEKTDYNEKQYENEIQATVESVQSILENSKIPILTFAVFTDLHNDKKYAANTLVDTMETIKALDKKLNFDGVFNLGDSIDGQNQTQKEAEDSISEVVAYLRSFTDRSHNLEGNHDNNIQSTWEKYGGYDASNKLTNAELHMLINKGSSNQKHNNSTRFTNYYIDYEEYGIRVVCISADYTTFTSDTKLWLRNVALKTDYNVIVFSHCATKDEWSENDIANGNYIEEPLNEFVQSGGTIIAYVCGHSHADLVITDNTIMWNEISIGAAKFKSVTEATTAMNGGVIQARNESDHTKILFDVMCIDTTNRKAHFIRCGSGQDRVVTY